MLESHGQKADDFLAYVHIRKVEFTDPAFTITLEQELKIIEKALPYLSTNTASLELAGFYHLHNFSVLGLAIRSCANLSEVLELFRHYPRLQWGICETHGRLEGDELVFELHAGKTQLERFLLERDMACVKTILSEAIAKPIQLKSVHFSFANKSAEKQQDFEAFFNCPVHFGAKQTEFYLPLSELEQRLPTADPLSKAFYEAQCARVSAEIDSPFLYSHLVRDHLSRLSPIPSLEYLAEQLNIEKRTLQRFLKREGETFSKILLDVRIKRASDLLRFSNKSHEQIAEELGFNDAVAFSHAFKEWMGLSPREWLKAQ